MGRALVWGLAVAGEATVQALRARGHEVVVAEDLPAGADAAFVEARAAACAAAGAEWVGSPDGAELAKLLAGCDLVAPSPGVPEHHRIVDACGHAGVELVSEVELAYRWEQQRPGGPRPMLAVTGTDGKTTTTLLAAAMLEAGGVRTVAAGNTETPLVAALDLDVDAFVVECTSFRLAYTPTFRAEGAAWLNLAPDHLDWHRSMASYEAAKAQVWANQRADDVAVGFATDPIVMRRLASAPGRRRTFGLDHADYRYVAGDDQLVGPAGPIARRAAMRRSLPHDITNALAASALVLETGLADEDAVGRALAEFVGPPHRLEHVAAIDGVDWFNDSKATTPHAARAAIAGFDGIVLIAGGYDKHVDLAPMAVEAHRVRAVLALGATRDRIAEIFASAPVVELVDDMEAAIGRAAALARPGEVVLLSPGCASFGLYRNFEERGDDFRRRVLDLAEARRGKDVDQ